MKEIKITTPTSGDPPAATSERSAAGGSNKDVDYGLEFEPQDSPDKRSSSSTQHQRSGATNQIRRREKPVASVVPDNSAQSAEFTTAAWHITRTGKRKVDIFEDQDIRRCVVSGSISEHDLVWRPGMTGWVKVNAVPEFQTLLSYVPQNKRLLTLDPDGVDWAHASLIASSGLLVLSIIGGYWGYSWFTGVLLLFLGYLISHGFVQVVRVLSQIKNCLPSSTERGDDNE